MNRSADASKFFLLTISINISSIWDVTTQVIETTNVIQNMIIHDHENICIIIKFYNLTIVSVCLSVFLWLYLYLYLSHPHRNEQRLI